MEKSYIKKVEYLVRKGVLVEVDCTNFSFHEILDVIDKYNNADSLTLFNFSKNNIFIAWNEDQIDFIAKIAKNKKVIIKL
jgi:hypothetical protein